MGKLKTQKLAAALALALLTFAAACGHARAKQGLEVSFENLNEQTVELSQYRGKVVLVNFWATWCSPCRAEIPDLIRLQEKYGSKGFTVLGVAMDVEGKSVVAPFVVKPQFRVDGKELAMDYPIVLGNQAIAAKFGGFLGLPASFVISKDGQIIKRVIGGIDPQGMDEFIQGQL